MTLPKTITIIAGEESGDKHAASLVHALKKTQPQLHFTGIGGIHMQQAGVTLIANLAQYGVTGLAEVLTHIKVIRSAFKAIKKHLSQVKPDLLILVDYPGFNLRLAKFAKKTLGLKILYYISPQIWAWKANRIHTIKAYVDHMAVILPFEKPLYEKAGVPVSFVGHPLIENLKIHPDVLALKASLNLDNGKRMMALLPGSRQHEIQYLMPILYQTAEKLHQRYPDLVFVIPVAKTLKKELILKFIPNPDLPVTLVDGQAQAVVQCSDYVIVASGTASLECALFQKPMCIIYKGSRLSYIAVMKLIQVKYFGLCNLLANQMVVPELLQDDCNPQELTEVMSELIDNETQAQRMKDRLGEIKSSLSASQADCTLPELVEDFI